MGLGPEPIKAHISLLKYHFLSEEKECPNGQKSLRFNFKMLSQMQFGHTIFLLPGVNCINFLCVAFAHADPKSAKKTDNLTIIFALLGSTSVKAECKTLMKLTTGVKMKFILS